jgi:glycerophosphoryl diester phosphodiesterase
VLKEYGYTSKSDKVYLQCFDANELKRINGELMPAMGMDLKLVQLMAETDWNETMVYDAKGKATPYDYDWMFKPGAMKTIATYAEGIGPWKPMVVTEPGTRQAGLHRHGERGPRGRPQGASLYLPSG